MASGAVAAVDPLVPDVDDDEVEEEVVGEYAAHEAKLQEAVAAVFTSKDCFGVHATACHIMEVLDEHTHEEVR